MHIKPRSKQQATSPDCLPCSIASLSERRIDGWWVWCAVVVAPPSPSPVGSAVASHSLVPTCRSCHGSLALVLTQRNPLHASTVRPGPEASASAGPHLPSFGIRSVRFCFDPIAPAAAGRRADDRSGPSVRPWGLASHYMPIGRCSVWTCGGWYIVPGVVRFAVVSEWHHGGPPGLASLLYEVVRARPWPIRPMFARSPAVRGSPIVMRLLALMPWRHCFSLGVWIFHVLWVPCAGGPCTPRRTTRTWRTRCARRSCRTM